MRIAAVTVSVNYQEFLYPCLENNWKHLDHWVIVTHPSDRLTYEMCRVANIRPVMSQHEFVPGVMFPKGKMINEGLAAIQDDCDWVVLLDSDILLPANTRKYLEACRLDPHTLYGTYYRRTIQSIRPGYQSADELLQCRGELVADNHCEPLGYFQMFAWPYRLPHPETYDHAGGDDRLLTATWRQRHDFSGRTQLLHGLVPVHYGPTGRYWKGRQ